MKGMNKQNIIINIIGVVLARTVFFGINPVAIGFFSSVYIEKTFRWIIFLATLLGMATVMPLVDVMKYGLIMLSITVVTSLIERKNKKIPVVTMSVISGVITTALALTQSTMQYNYQYYIQKAVLEGVIVFALVGIFHKGVSYIQNSKKGQAIKNEEIISVSIIAAMVVYVLPEFRGLPFSITETAVFFMVLFLGYKYGAGGGAIAGAACGIAYGLRGDASGFLSVAGMMCMGGILAGMFRTAGRLVSAAIYGVCVLALTYVYKDGYFDVGQISAICSGIVIFLLLPRNISYVLDIGEKTEGEEVFVKQNLQAIARDKLQEFAGSFKKLSNTFYSIADTQTALSRNDVNQIFDDLSENLCKQCDNCSLCWKNEFYDTYKAAFTMLNSAEKNGIILEKDIPDTFAGRCTSLPAFLAETNRGLEVAKLNLNWHNRMAESREAIAGQLMEVSNIINEFSKELYETVEVKDSKEAAITKKLSENHIEVNKIAILEKRNKKHEIYITAKTRRGRCITTREMASIISDAFGKKMKPSDGTKNIISKEKDTLIFLEDTNFKTLTGMARTTKANEKISGDNYSFIHLANGEMIMTLSDGMGTGVKACAESESVIELLEHFMEAGFKEESAIKLINSILVLKSENQSFSTIDMSIVDLFTGICQFIKIGASTTFIKRENWVETISSTTLPVGVFNHVDFDGITKKLYHGDFIIMVTDGVLDCIQEDNKEKFIEDVIMEITSQNPQEIANIILDKAIEQNNYTAVDDMTVVVAGLWKS